MRLPAARQAARPHLHLLLPDHPPLLPGQALFEKYDANKDHMLDVDEGVALLKAIASLREMQ